MVYFTEDIVDVSVRFTSIEWAEKLNDKESEQFKTVSGKIVKAVCLIFASYTLCMHMHIYMCKLNFGLHEPNPTYNIFDSLEFIFLVLSNGAALE